MSLKTKGNLLLCSFWAIRRIKLLISEKERTKKFGLSKYRDIRLIWEIFFIMRVSNGDRGIYSLVPGKVFKPYNLCILEKRKRIIVSHTREIFSIYRGFRRWILQNS